ncbi:hypothetical protein ACFXAZ_22470 [Streptomyces sp. NPDC059477]|uniref:hypothetical protein n=1 Tax=Streptomyces sp. NPDC059477 TaxID=3346847 RepID=UPI0036C9E9F6
MSGTGRGRRIAVVAACAVLAGTLVAGIGATVVTVRNADRDAGAPRWAFPKATAEGPVAPVTQGLAGMLVPYGSEGGWSRGPDVGQYGHDAQLSGAEAAALRKETLRGLPRSLRTEMEEEIDGQRSQGLALRSYFSADSPTFVYDEDIFSANITLERMANRTAVQDVSRLAREMLGTLTDSESLEIEGYEDAECFVASDESGAVEFWEPRGLSTVLCSAAVGDVLVSVVASGTESLDRVRVTDLVRTQLDRITEPGKAI